MRVRPAILGLVTVVALLRPATSQAQTTDPPYLSQMPTVERVQAEIKGTDPMDTAARQMGAFWQLQQIVETLAGPRRYRNQLTPDEGRLIGQYRYGYSSAEQPYAHIQNAPSHPDKPKWYQMHAFYETDPGFLDELLQRWFPSDFRTAFYGVTGKQPPTERLDASPYDPSKEAEVLKAKLQIAQASVSLAISFREKQNDAEANKTFEEAAAAYKQIIVDFPFDTFPSVTSAYLGLGNIYTNYLHQYDRALPVWKELHALTPNDGSVVILRGQTLYELKNYDEAIKAFRQALGMKADADMLAIAHISLGYIYRNQKQYDKALIENKEALRMQPGNGSASHSLGINYYYLKDYPSAVDAFHQAVEFKYAFPWQSYNWIGYIHNEQGQYEKALPVLLEALKVKPDYPNTSNNLGVCYLGLKRLSDAIGAFQEAIRKNPQESQWRYNLGHAYVKAGRKTEAMEVYKELQTIDEAKAQELYDLINEPSGKTSEPNAAVGAPE